MELIKYNTEYKQHWDNFVLKAKNSTFLFLRNFMDYHSDRFEDHSLLIFEKNKLLALFPCNISEDIAESHGGLTYGGLVISRGNTVEEIIRIFNSINSYYHNKGIKHMVYKPVPYIYHQYPSEEDLYILFRLNALLIGRNISSAIKMNNKIKFTQSRKGGISKAVKNNIRVKQSEDFRGFWKILENNLENKFGKKPVHTLNEITLLANRFPSNIKLFEVSDTNRNILAGTVIFEENKTVHTQYISSTPEGRQLGSLDYLFDHLINEIYSEKDYFDFGQSTEKHGLILNSNLIFQKEGFGGRGVCYDIYKYETNATIEI